MVNRQPVADFFPLNWRQIAAKFNFKLPAEAIERIIVQVARAILNRLPLIVLDLYVLIQILVQLAVQGIKAVAAGNAAFIVNQLLDFQVSLVNQTLH